MIPVALMIHWLAAFLLIGMATGALLEAKSASLIPKSLFLWPLAGLLFGLLALAAPLARGSHGSGQVIVIGTGVAMLACSVQAFLVNIRKLARWPSGAVWLSLVVVALLHQIPYSGFQEPAFRTFFRRFSGLLWAAIGVAKVLRERSVSQEGGIPAWITLLYLQAALIASFPH